MIHGYIEIMRQDHAVYLQLMQDGAPRHAAEESYEELAERRIYAIF